MKRMTMKRKSIAEYQRLEKIYKHAKKHKIESVMMSTLASMNTLSKLLGYEPKQETEVQE